MQLTPNLLKKQCAQDRIERMPDKVVEAFLAQSRDLCGNSAARRPSISADERFARRQLQRMLWSSMATRTRKSQPMNDS